MAGDLPVVRDHKTLPLQLAELDVLKGELWEARERWRAGERKREVERRTDSQTLLK